MDVRTDISFVAGQTYFVVSIIAYKIIERVGVFHIRTPTARKSAGRTCFLNNDLCSIRQRCGQIQNHCIAKVNVVHLSSGRIIRKDGRSGNIETCGTGITVGPLVRQRTALTGCQIVCKTTAGDDDCSIAGRFYSTAVHSRIIIDSAALYDQGGIAAENENTATDITVCNVLADIAAYKFHFAASNVYAATIV